LLSRARGAPPRGGGKKGLARAESAPSLVRPAKIATVDAARILRQIGKPAVKDAKKVKDKLRELGVG